ncbi:sensor histidine kinase [Clostridium brassicae]|uniref:GHKL domain-containing protein n=1 Tax=Clostridium brassicae TaxID=2999072 RepID=A0ABT4D868_9CLOT|nr:sensor histidine kinase [Clostridium brassicae]MCY6958481.1 GHKL domain-containing protein [Clostridium brassicae]
MFVYIQSFLIIVLEIFCCKIFFEAFGEKRTEKNIYRNYGIIATLMLSVYFFALFFANYFTFKQVSIIVVSTILMYLYLNINIIKSLIVSMLFQGLLLVVDYFAFSINTMSLFNGETAGQAYIFESFLVIIFGKALLFFVVIVIKKNIGNKYPTILKDTEWIRFIFFPLFTICVIIAILSISDCVTSKKQADIFFIIAFGLAGMNIVVFYLINDILEREMKIHKNKIFEMQVKSQTNMYLSISENFNKQNKKTHEYKNQIICINSLVKKKHYTELEEYLKNISDNLNKELDAINTNNVIVNAILNTKYQEAINKNIIFVLKVNDLSNIKISNEDVVVILSNLLDNAIEACEKCSDNKILKFKFINKDDFIVISVKNTYTNNILYSNGRVLTSKENKEEHGVGISNVVNIIEKYGGSYIIKSNGNEFYFSILISQ